MSGFLPNYIGKIRDSIAGEYSDLISYKPGSFVYYNGELYTCVKETNGMFSFEAWQKCRVTDIAAPVGAVGDGVNQRTVTAIYERDKIYNPGALVMWGGFLYKCISTTTKGEFNPSNWVETTIMAEAGGGGGGSVISVNGKTGIVVLNSSDVGAYSQSETNTLLAAKADASSTYTKTEVDTIAGARVLKPATAGTVGQVLSLKTATGETEWINAGGTSAVTSVQGKTGDVIIYGDEIKVSTDVGALTVKAALDTKTKDTAIADLYSQYSTYALDSLVMHEGELYRNIIPITVAEPFDASKWAKTNSVSVASAVITNKLEDTSVTAAYDSSATYAVGDLVVHEGTFYKCIAAITTPKAFDDADWAATTILSEIPSTAALAKSSAIADDFNAASAYVIGDVVMHAGLQYRAIDNKAAGAVWDATKWIAITSENRIEDAECNLADKFNKANAYSKNDLVIFNDKLYKANKDIAAGTEFSTADFDSIKVKELIPSGKASYREYNSAVTFVLGARVHYEGAYYMAKQDVPAGILPTTPAYWEEVTPDFEVAKEFAALAACLGFTRTVAWDTTTNEFVYTYSI